MTLYATRPCVDMKRGAHSCRPAAKARRQINTHTCIMLRGGARGRYVWEKDDTKRTHICVHTRAQGTYAAAQPPSSLDTHAPAGRGANADGAAETRSDSSGEPQMHGLYVPQMHGLYVPGPGVAVARWKRSIAPQRVSLLVIGRDAEKNVESGCGPKVEYAGNCGPGGPR